MTYLVERLAELRRHLVHLRELRPRATTQALETDLSLHNDVMFSLLMVCQLVIDIAGDLSAQRGERFEKYADAIRSLVRDSRFDADLVKELAKLAGFRNVVVHEYISVDYGRVMAALENLEPVQRFMEIVARGHQ